MQCKETRDSRYDYQHAKCEDPLLIDNWLSLVQNTVQNMVLLTRIYPIWMKQTRESIIATARVITGSEAHDCRAQTIQPKNTEWATAVTAVNASGWLYHHR